MSKEDKKIWDYFEDNIEYPKNIADNPIPYGEVWTYVSSTFLNGFINYVKPIGCYVVNRYTEETEDISDREVSICDKGKFGNWHKFSGTKKGLIDLIVSEEKEVYHTRLNCFADDIIILAKIETESDEENKYIFFWFDSDVSDCSIGKFKTNDSQEEILNSIENWLKETYADDKTGHEASHDELSSGYHKLPLSFLQGWISY
jgi:hypothetical protein